MAKNTLINRQNVRRFVLEFAERSRAHKFTQVAESVYEQVEAAVREKCRGIVRQQPSVGKTIR
ncbi:MAG: hypothetical protein O3C69_03645 [Chloroflexi bacterium]|nr:hypothetical protein [Chloroflexota bacterium]